MLANAQGEHAIAVPVLDAAVRLLPLSTGPDTGWGDQESRLAIEAVAAHCAIGDVTGAVEIGELGRGILLAAQPRSRSDLTELDDRLPGLAEPFRRVRELLNAPGTAGDRTALWARSAPQASRTSCSHHDWPISRKPRRVERSSWSTRPTSARTPS